jgi:hypothetical protein
MFISALHRALVPRALRNQGRRAPLRLRLPLAFIYRVYIAQLALSGSVNAHPAHHAYAGAPVFVYVEAVDFDIA